MPAEVVSLTSTTPVLVDAGVTAVIEVGEVTVNSFAGSFPNDTLVTVGFSKFRPVILTFLPPAIEPFAGDSLVTVGGSPRRCTQVSVALLYTCCR